VATFIHADVDIKVQAGRENKHEAEVIRALLSKGMKKSTGKAQESTGDSLLHWLQSVVRDRPLILPTDVCVETLNSMS
jgi:hypothetical protein